MPCTKSPNKKTVEHKVNVIKKIKTIWLVKATAKGVKLKKLQNKIKIKKLNIKGIKRSALIPACCFIIFKTKKKTNSKKLCHILGKKKNWVEKKNVYNKIKIISINKGIRTLGIPTKPKTKNKSNCSKGENKKKLEKSSKFINNTYL